MPSLKCTCLPERDRERELTPGNPVVSVEALGGKNSMYIFAELHISVPFSCLFFFPAKERVI